ncbi:peptidyl-prolyl cis-trans isomerase [Theileria orientalis]|uniref:Peptidyl-prolyl cis-trans isomerase n=1 Tax=Theileria orientalis TaxID=68886 RepID=A0A976QR69_THEOR|nr:peptidyl-prolyl cis-trans isomerase [Theileria orientalis]
MEISGDISPSEKEALTKEFRDLEEIRDREAKSRAVVLEILGDLPDADITPPKNVLFVCKLNPVTEEGDLKIIFSRFGTVKKCDIIKDYVTGDSLQYAFIEFETEASCNEAYFKMQNVLIDDRRIHVDFCQSVSGFWKRYYFKESFTRKRKESSDYRRIDHHRRKPERDDTHSHKPRRHRSLEENRSHHKNGTRHTTHPGAEGRLGSRGPSESYRRRHRPITSGRTSSSSPDAHCEQARLSSSRDRFGRRKDHRTRRGSRYGSPPRRSRLSISPSEESRRKRSSPRRRNMKIERFGRHSSRSRTRSRDRGRIYRARSRSRERPRQRHGRSPSPRSVSS